VESVTDKPAEIDVETWESWQKRTISALHEFKPLRCALVRIFLPQLCANFMIWQTTWERQHVAGYQSSFK
jgi:hypothetical protein